MDPPTTPNFFSLPLELRDQIYDLILEYQHHVIRRGPHVTVTHENAAVRVQLVCHQIRQELLLRAKQFHQLLVISFRSELPHYPTSAYITAATRTLQHIKFDIQDGISVDSHFALTRRGLRDLAARFQTRWDTIQGICRQMTDLKRIDVQLIAIGSPSPGEYIEQLNSLNDGVEPLSAPEVNYIVQVYATHRWSYDDETPYKVQVYKQNSRERLEWNYETPASEGEAVSSDSE